MPRGSKSPGHEDTGRTLQTAETFPPNDMERQISYRASTGLAFGLASLGFGCSSLSTWEWDLTMQISTSLLLPPPPL